jgi:hypothetical protein
MRKDFNHTIQITTLESSIEDVLILKAQSRVHSFKGPVEDHSILLIFVPLWYSFAGTPEKLHLTIFCILRKYPCRSAQGCFYLLSEYESLLK